MRLALYQPDIPQNTGTILRLCACLDVPCDLIGPPGFNFSDRAFRRAGLDYLDRLDLARHGSFDAFMAAQRVQKRRVVLLSTHAPERYTQFAFGPADTLLAGRESAGVPDEVAADVDAAVSIPLAAGMRSLNVAVASAMVLGEALRQTVQQ